MNTTVIVLIGVAGAVLFWPQIATWLQSTSGPVFQSSNPNAPNYIPPYTANIPGVSQLTTQPPGSSTTGHAPGPSATQLSGLTAGAASSIGPALGLTAAATAGIAAGAGIVAYLIVAKGLFRGGAEALYVNPARDEFKALFTNFMPYTSGDPGYFGLHWLLASLGRDDLGVRFDQADTRRKWESVVNEIEALITSNPTQVIELRTYIATHPKVA